MELLETYLEQSPKDLIRKRILAGMILNSWSKNQELPSRFIDAGTNIAQDVVDAQPKLAINYFLLARMQRASDDLPAALANAEKALKKIRPTSVYARQIKKFIAENENENKPAPEADDS